MDLPELEDTIQEVKATVRDRVDLSKDISDEEVMEFIINIVFEKSKKKPLSVKDKQYIVNMVFNSMRKLDILQPIIEDQDVTEIMVNGHNCIFVERNGRTYQINQQFESQRKLEDVIQSIVAKVNRAVNETSPMVDARLEDGSRVNVVLPPIALNGPILTIRKFPNKPITIKDLVAFGSINEEIAEVLERLVKARFNIFISGGTGSGKTTFLNALSNFIPHDERIITIEDSAELQILNVKNIVKLETRNANVEGKGAITIRDLIKTSLRMRPDRIIVGEVRGAEAIDMLQAMNTGHDGSLSTGHANSSRDILSRLETMVLAGAQLPLEAIRQQITSAIDIVIHLARIRDKSRKLMEISEVVAYNKGEIILNPLYYFKEEGETKEKKIIGSFIRTENELKNNHKLEMAGLSKEF
ncbi:CpaF family protein [Alkaliphilus serpentinus]|uniref:CpaF family protein n=1 Tax=Alkaliphilus serpentinus TaxID=1482731 RepID=A0A833MF69_9FIRM|nr:CpaF family protein [Alkaliphilus serpentinus]KAB3532860.1 CpaF family protein [Alkaliphilus serpentinus]